MSRQKLHSPLRGTGEVKAKTRTEAEKRIESGYEDPMNRVSSLSEVGEYISKLLKLSKKKNF